ncbi:5'/3'-nucleotidase SurE [Streptomyces chryseus]|uniref:5'-nucleotidase n=1 Tax=Streptomyces chryseus TaxID=68186 RepID=A0ABQ3DJW6_9ACTN|nr:5'/3'-nucleotidase SurE [Streptomyces chryseus]GHA95913.1 stationary phase survival protein SurE [Streptomyces chryseus]
MTTTAGRRATAVLAAAGTLLLAVTAGAQAQVPRPPDRDQRQYGGAQPLAGLRVLMSNDDSMRMARPDASDGKGLYEARRALCAAGADVVVMAPWANQSGAGTSATSGGHLTVQRRAVLPGDYAKDCSGTPSRGAVYGVCKGTSPCGPESASATPADTVRLGLGGGLAAKAGWADGPDLVVSGSNYGPNVASVVNESGTVGAALAAIDEGVPAVALNSSYDPAVTTSLEVADRTYRRTGEFGADFIGRLHRRGLLTTKFVVNVNYPHLAEGRRPRSTAWTSVGTQKVVRSVYRGSGDTFAVGGAICAPGAAECRPETKRDADFTLLQRGHVTVTPVSPDRTFTGSEAARLARYVRTSR